MKKFRMMLPALAVIFAVGGAIAGDFFSPVNAYYRIASTCQPGQLSTEQSNCQISNDSQYPVCTVKVGTNHYPAFDKTGCLDQLRQIP